MCSGPCKWVWIWRLNRSFVSQAPPDLTSRKRGSAFRRVAADLPRWSGVDPVMLDLPTGPTSSPSYPRVRHVYGAAHDVDREEAEPLAGLEVSNPWPMPGWTEHLVIDALIESEEFVPALRWMFEVDAISRNGAASRAPVGNLAHFRWRARPKRAFERPQELASATPVVLAQSLTQRQEALRLFDLQAVAQLGAQNLADRVTGQLRNEHKSAGPLVRRGMRSRKCATRSASLTSPDGMRAKAAISSPSRDLAKPTTATSFDPRMAGEHGFDLRWMHAHSLRRV